MRVTPWNSCPHLFEKGEAVISGNRHTGTGLAISAGWCVAIGNVHMNVRSDKAVVVM